MLITGAASGIGRETAFSFADRGATLELTDIDSPGLERTALLCRKLGASVTTHVADVSSESDMARVAGKVHERISALDVLINNAGVGVGGSFIGTDLGTWDWAISINLKGVVHGCHFFVPKMVDRGAGGHVVNVASLAGLAATKDMPVYGATKFAVVGLSESLRAELAPARIEVTTVCPGIINTPIVQSSRLTGNLSKDPGARQAGVEGYRKRNYGPERVAEAIANAVLKGRGGLLPVSPESWIVYFGKRFAPAWTERLLERQLAKSSAQPAQ